MNAGLERLWAVLVEADDGSEYPVTLPTPLGAMPLLATTVELVEVIRARGADIAGVVGHRVRLVELEVVASELLGPPAPGQAGYL